MSPNKRNKSGLPRRHILGRVPTAEFVGRDAELNAITQISTLDGSAHAILLLAAPGCGASELLLQVYDYVFQAREGPFPVYFAVSRSDGTALNAAQRFLRTFLAQMAAFRRNEPWLSSAVMAHSDLVELAMPADQEWVSELVEAVERERSNDDHTAAARLCMSAPLRAETHGLRPMVLLDSLHLSEYLAGDISLSTEFAKAFRHFGGPFVLSGLRRYLLDYVQTAPGCFEHTRTVRLDRLDDPDARRVVEYLAERGGVVVSAQACDLLVQQLNARPFYLTSVIQAAREADARLDNFLDAQKLYVDEIMGGRTNRRFNSILEVVAPAPATRRALVRVLYESVESESGKAPIEGWRKRLALEPSILQRMLRTLYQHELVNVDANFVETARSSTVWIDFLRAQYRLEIGAEPRALVVADMLVAALERAAEIMARHYRQIAAVPLRELLSRFNCQHAPASLFNCGRFSRMHLGMSREEIAESITAETDMVRVPKVVHVATCASFHPPIAQFCDDQRCVVAHGFEGGTYASTHETVWLAAEIDVQHEAGHGITELWCDRLRTIARACNFRQPRIWLIASEGFSADASEYLSKQDAYGSSRIQLELLREALDLAGKQMQKDAVPQDEFELVIPMGSDTELIAAHTVDQIARRIKFSAEAINQIKTALVEACINAAEHSLSPERKIYQRFQVESDKLTVIVSSRGVILPAGNGDNRFSASGGKGGDKGKGATGRRGWGMEIIRKLMDEVEFEQVDDGTRLRMTKYLSK